MSCGALRVDDARFCGTCGHPFNAGSSSPATGARGIASSAKVAAGLAWLGCAALTAYLGFVQLRDAPVTDEGSFPVVGIGNLIAAATTLLVGSRVLTNADRGFLASSVAWAVFVVVWNGGQIAYGVTHWASVGAIVAALVAGVMSIVASRSMPRPPPPVTFGPDWERPPSAHGSATPPPTFVPLSPVKPSADEQPPTSSSGATG